MALLDEETGRGLCIACGGCSGKGGEPVFCDFFASRPGATELPSLSRVRAVWFSRVIVRDVDYDGSLSGDWWFREDRSFLRAVEVMEVEDLECVRCESLEGSCLNRTLAEVPILRHLSSTAKHW